MPDKVSQRIFYADALRVFAILAVITQHLASLYTDQYNSIPITWWWVGNLWDSFARWGVINFVMISGLLLLQNRQENFDVFLFLKKRLLRIIIPLFSWSVIYWLWVNREKVSGLADLPYKTIFLNFIQGSVHYHLWFVYMIAGLYLMTPFGVYFIRHAYIRQIKYVLGLWLVFNIFFPAVSSFTGIQIGIKIDIQLYLGYYILGYYLHIVELDAVQKYLIYVIGVICYAITVIGSYYFTKAGNNTHHQYFYGYSSFNIMMMAVAVFVFFKSIKWDKYSFLIRSVTIHKILADVSSLTYGIYLMHALVLELVYYYYFRFFGTREPIIGIPLMALTTFSLCLVLNKIISKIPVARTLIQ